MARAHHCDVAQWLARALVERQLRVDEYPQEGWVAAQRYADFSWEDLVDLWLCTTRLIMHVLAQIPEDKLTMPCKVGIETPIALSKLVDRYVEHSKDIVG